VLTPLQPILNTPNSFGLSVLDVIDKAVCWVDQIAQNDSRVVATVTGSTNPNCHLRYTFG
jgi:hypothetical protein